MDEQSARDAMATSGGEDPARATGHGARQSFDLCDLEEQGVSFYSFSVKQTIHGGLAVAS
jgi:hypothetical protein